MANRDQLNFLLDCANDTENGSTRWNNWREKNNIQRPELSGVNLQSLTLHRYNFSGANLQNSNLSQANFFDSLFIMANLDGAMLVKAELRGTLFTQASLVRTNLTEAILSFARFVESNCQSAIFKGATLTNALLINSKFTNTNFQDAILITSNFAKSNLQNSDLSRAILSGANLSNADLSGANITGATVFGISAWNVNTSNLTQQDLIITNSYETELTVDDIEIAQFIYLISHNEKLSRVIDRITSKVVLILGRFTIERKNVLDGIKKTLRQLGFVSIVFDFEKPGSRDLTETIGLIGRMSTFIVADLTEAKSLPQELSELIPSNPSIVVVPILLKGSNGYSMFEHWTRYDWVLNIQEYESPEWLIDNISSLILDPVEKYLTSKKPID